MEDVDVMLMAMRGIHYFFDSANYLDAGG